MIKCIGLIYKSIIYYIIKYKSNIKYLNVYVIVYLLFI